MSSNQFLKNAEAIISIDARGFIFGSAIAPGQSIVFYAGDTCIGGGYIETRSNKNIS